MPANEVSMRKVRELLRLYFNVQLSQHQIAASLGLSVVNKYINLAKTAGLLWPLTAELENDIALKQMLSFPKSSAKLSQTFDFAAIHSALKQNHVILQLLWEEYRAVTKNPTAIPIIACFIVAGLKLKIIVCSKLIKRVKRFLRKS